MGSPEALQIIGDIGQQYKLVTPLTSTAYSQVYCGVNRSTEEPVIIKIPAPDVLPGILLKERILHALNGDDPHVVTIDGHGVWNDKPYLATRQQEGGTLRPLLEDMSACPEGTIIRESVIDRLNGEIDTADPDEHPTIDFPSLIEVKEALQLRHVSDAIQELENQDSLDTDAVVGLITDAARELGHEIDSEGMVAKELALLVLKEMPCVKRGYDGETILHRVNLLHGVAQGIVAIHRSGTIHRDIKAENVGIGKDGVARVLDFGIATQRPGYRTIVTGSLGNIAPEAYIGEVTQQTDDFALAALAYQILTGRAPWTPPSKDFQAHYETMHESVPTHPSDLGKHISGSLGDTIMKGLAIDPGVRASDVELRDSFAAVVA